MLKEEEVEQMEEKSREAMLAQRGEDFQKPKVINISQQSCNDKQ